MRCAAGIRRQARLGRDPVHPAGARPVAKRIELWFRRHRISNPLIYATVGGHEAIVSMVALGCGIALIPSVVVDNSPEPVRNRISQLDNISMVEPFELGVCVQKSASAIR